MTNFRKAVLATAILLLGFVAFARSQATASKAPSGTTAAAHKELIALEKEFDEAYKNRDRATLDRLIALDVTFIDETGPSNKKEFIETAVKDTKVDYYTVTGLTARLYGDTGIVNGRWTAKYSVSGKDYSGVYLFTDVYSKHQGRWLLVASQDTRLSK